MHAEIYPKIGIQLSARREFNSQFQNNTTDTTLNKTADFDLSDDSCGSKTNGNTEDHAISQSNILNNTTTSQFSDHFRGTMKSDSLVAELSLICEEDTNNMTLPNAPIIPSPTTSLAPTMKCKTRVSSGAVNSLHLIIIVKHQVLAVES